MPERPGGPARRPERSTRATPCSSQASSRPYWAAHKSGPMPPGPPPTTTGANGLLSITASTEDIAEHPHDAMHHLRVDRPRCWQVYAGGGQFRAVRAGSGVLLVGRQRGQRMEERPHLDLGLDGGRQDGVALAGRHLHAGKPHDGLTEAIHRRRKAHARDGLQRITVEIGDTLVAGP